MEDACMIVKEEGTMEMELISRETIKPCAATPPDLTIYPLSLFDNCVAPNAVPLIYFYASDTDEACKVSMLKESLSEALSIYYPFAGRLNNERCIIECNDEGVSFLVTRIKTHLSHLLHNPTETLLNPLFPDDLQWKEIGMGSLLAVQINCFACGGIAIAVCMSHKLGDASTLFNFINDWATLKRKSSTITTLPLLALGSSLFPQGDFPVSPPFAFLGNNTSVRCTRLVFEGSQIESLKAMVSSHNVKNPTRVEVVIAMLYKCVVSASRLSAENTALRVTINFRKRMVPPLPDKSVGNLVSSFYASPLEKRQVELEELVRKMREGLSEFCGKYVSNFGDLTFTSKFLIDSGKTTSSFAGKTRSMLFFGSWCRFSMYEADFGWGKPIWVTSSGCPMKNTVVLMDWRDGKGIEAIVNMDMQDMAIFETHLDLLQFASLNPNRWTS